jgi:hypothetical protein
VHPGTCKNLPVSAENLDNEECRGGPSTTPNADNEVGNGAAGADGASSPTGYRWSGYPRAHPHRPVDAHAGRRLHQGVFHRRRHERRDFRKDPVIRDLSDHEDEGIVALQEVLGADEEASRCIGNISGESHHGVAGPLRLLRRKGKRLNRNCDGGDEGHYQTGNSMSFCHIRNIVHPQWCLNVG